MKKTLISLFLMMSANSFSCEHCLGKIFNKIYSSQKEYENILMKNPHMDDETKIMLKVYLEGLKEAFILSSAFIVDQHPELKVENLDHDSF